MALASALPSHHAVVELLRIGVGTVVVHRLRLDEDRRRQWAQALQQRDSGVRLRWQDPALLIVDLVAPSAPTH